jgi:hypothetical protein
VLFFQRGARSVVIALWIHFSLLAQKGTVAERQQQASVSFRFVGCKSDGQTGPMDAPKGTSRVIPGSRVAAEKLAYYKSDLGVGVLAPRGWSCFGTYGSAGDTLIVSPQPIDLAHIFSTGPGDLSGSAIEVAYRFGDTSGRFEVADIIARVFPAYKGFVSGVMKEGPPGDTFTFGPYAGDSMTYKSKSLVEYRTPAQTDGLGTRSWLQKSGRPIDGAAILIGHTPDLVLVSVRLPLDQMALTSVIVREVERESALCPCN